MEKQGSLREKEFLPLQKNGPVQVPIEGGEN